MATLKQIKDMQRSKPCCQNTLVFRDGFVVFTKRERVWVRIEEMYNSRHFHGLGTPPPLIPGHGQRCVGASMVRTVSGHIPLQTF